MTDSSHGSSKATFVYALASVAGLVFLLMWMQGAFEHKVAPGLSEAVAAEKAARGPTAKVTRREADDVFAWPGTVTAKTVTQVAPKIPGRLLDITVRAGDRVKRGQVLARMDEAEIQAHLGQARSALVAAEAESGRLRADAGRLQNLYAKQAATRQDLDTALAAARAAAARVDEAREAIRAIESRLSETVLRAPFDGVVVQRNQEPGDVALPGGAVVTLQQSQQLRIEAAIPANCAGLVRIGNELKARTANPARDFRVLVDEIQPAADPRTRTVLVKARLPDGSGVSPGAFGWLYQSCGRSDVLLVPETAVSRIGQLESVRLVVNGEVKLRHVRTGKRHDGLVEILSGLNEGDVVQLAGGR
jgi:RND family efflux transporter MFP subunit